ncbi:unnamed protein product [Bursaphelenchus okinawaensis]|uniref:Uncharacterized protein n=1 Tax=Bursaphelenchus okinawaensis TaxID=465554 RepID=A0A811KYI6_9BILA|nr:unnamed protein product [Bursaphelenchus okinawaensis]CAG9114612.1 unnamed protein product [Bursaphelenchus okinawaensis]
MTQNLITFFLLLTVTTVTALTECVGAKGKVYCNGEPYPGAHVRLYDIDEVPGYGPISNLLQMLNPDDLMDRTMSTGEGEYELSGCAKDFDWIAMTNQIEPFIFINHKCNGKRETMLIEVEVDRTDDYMTPEFDAGIIELSNRLH